MHSISRIFLFLISLTFVARAASPAYNTSTGVISPTQFLKLDAAELKVMGVNVLTNAGDSYQSNFTTVNLVVTNELSVKGSIKANTLIVTNNVTLYNNTYVSNFFATAGVVSNDFRVLGDLYVGGVLLETIYSGDGTLTGDRIVNGGGNDLRITNANFSIGTGGITFNDDTVSSALLNAHTTSATGGFQPFWLTSQYSGMGDVGEMNSDVYADYMRFFIGINGNGIELLSTPSGSSITISGNTVATYAGITNTLTFALSDMTTALTTGTNKNYWYAPAEGMTIKWVRATLATASSSGTPTFDVNEAGTTILSTKITIDQDEWDSLNAATPPVISDSAIAGKAKVDFDIDVAGTGAAGAQIQVGYTVP